MKAQMEMDNETRPLCASGPKREPTGEQQPTFCEARASDSNDNGNSNSNNDDDDD
eukprot:CAMPEP_0206502266 /NCGR_PEP_ID=MMETSP0324_2-20121206/53889_1 /ASSEMBLY_ACC=CAM_ASM_000836 /TAXON_ID=2866 /ORGANISM="Crypthecodinium cohnii, Strain Seligo" /LENGTH=54 /DNA_ID=CAMNT_0053990415 /DNA_START=1 /DNA_END=162 /DNA_ORIENTATION=-